MEITRDILKSLIKEELLKVKKPEINESLDAKTAQKLEAEILAAYQQMTTPTDVDQTYADTGESVSKDPRVMHDEAVEFLHLVVDDVISGNTLENPRTLNEDGHSDVPSAVRAMKTIIEDAGQMLQVLEQTGEGSLPTWWTNKMAVSASMMNKMRDYLLYPKAMDEGFMDAVKRKIGTMPDDRSTVEKIKSHPEMKGRDKLGPARGPIMSVIEKYASEEEMETILSETDCEAGLEFCVLGSWVGCTAKVPFIEICNGLDDDCDGSIDEDLDCLCTIDMVGALFPCTEGPLICGQGYKTCECFDENCEQIFMSECLAMCSYQNPVPESCDKFKGIIVVIVIQEIQKLYLLEYVFPVK